MELTCGEVHCQVLHFGILDLPERLSTVKEEEEKIFLILTLGTSRGVPGVQVLPTGINYYSRGLYYKSFTIIIYDRIDSGQYYKSTIMIISYDHSLILDCKLRSKVMVVTYAPN
jgi:hypothetical protein